MVKNKDILLCFCKSFLEMAVERYDDNSNKVFFWGIHCLLSPWLGLVRSLGQVVRVVVVKFAIDLLSHRKICKKLVKTNKTVSAQKLIEFCRIKLAHKRTPAFSMY